MSLLVPFPGMFAARVKPSCRPTVPAASGR